MDRRRRAARTVALMSLFTMTDTQTDVPIASFDGDGSDLVSLIIGIDPVQAGSGDPSPDNIRPITGWTGANIHVSPTTDAEDGTTYTIAFPSEAETVYGGQLDVTTGKLTVTMVSVDLGTLNWGKSESANGNNFYSNGLQDAIKPSTGDAVIQNILCSHYKSVSWSTFTLAASNLVVSQVVKQIRIKDADYASVTASAFKTAMSGVQFVYPLATPIVYNLTPTEVSTLLGTNNIWADAGDIKYIEYNI